MTGDFYQENLKSITFLIFYFVIVRAKKIIKDIKGSIEGRLKRIHKS